MGLGQKNLLPYVNVLLKFGTFISPSLGLQRFYAFKFYLLFLYIASNLSNQNMKKRKF